MEAGASSTNRPRTRQRAYKKPPPLEVPHIDDDAAERKRVLNVLAQRRYRERKRLNRLKANSAENAEPESHSTQAAEPTTAEEVIEMPAVPSSTQGMIPSAVITIPLTVQGSDMMAGLDLSLPSWDPLADVTLTSVLPDTGALPDFLTDDNVTSGETVTQPQAELPMGFTGSESFPSVFDASSSLGASSSSSSPDWNFPDSYHLPILELTLLKAVVRIADRLNCKTGLWNLDCISPFNTGTATPSDQLPATWRPTPSQLMIPHHPMFDLLPWPGVRERAITILSLPDDLRPPSAQGPLAMVNFAYDIEDSAEGVRIYGEDPYDASNWELGQVAFERWWFLFDNNIIETSNRWRRLRGAPPLLKSASPSPSAEASSYTS
ncbi:hypothetical protein N0V84_004740 [Fusarium piperis]|uniref:BZIP domain-containing protein n=1 Tax=Fusarium piperis TaxID=1435070 RepID=A0A9W9BQ59_9HYPO|nr:hypothetical protein N0V84_004740 [Fusarium piperis]